MIEINLVDMFMLIIGVSAAGFLLLQLYLFDDRAALFLIMLLLVLPIGVFANEMELKKEKA